MEQNNEQDPPVPDTRYAFRTGWPRLPVLPVETLPQDYNLPKFLPDWTTNVEEILHIMERNGVLIVDNYLCYRYSKGAPVPEGKPTYLIYSNLQDEGQNITAWRQAVSDVISTFQQKKIHNVAIEIADQQCNCKIKTDIIHPDETEVLQAWNEWMPRIAECLSGHNHNWISLDLLHRSWIGAQQNVKATVVISAADANDSKWNQTLDTLKAILPKFLGVELVYLETILGVDTSIDSDEIRDDGIEWMKMLAYQDPKLIPMGTSCGRRWKIAEKDAKAYVGEDSQLSSVSGTLGGLLKLKGSTQQYGLSNRHVFIEDSDSEAPEEQRTSAVAPSNTDYSKTLSRLGANILKLSKHDEHQLRRFGGLQQADDSGRSLIMMARANLAVHTKMMSQVKKLDRDIGRVYASSTQGFILNEKMEKNEKRNVRETGFPTGVSSSSTRKMKSRQQLPKHIPAESLAPVPGHLERAETPDTLVRHVS
jgi:hypothetical protein